MLYDSLHRKLLSLADEVLVYPAWSRFPLRTQYARRAFLDHRHGRLTNYALQIKDKEEFVRQLTTNLPTSRILSAGCGDKSQCAHAPISPSCRRFQRLN